MVYMCDMGTNRTSLMPPYWVGKKRTFFKTEEIFCTKKGILEVLVRLYSGSEH